MNRYTLTCSAEQAALLVRALDLYSRIGIGQFEEILNVYDAQHTMEVSLRQDARLAINEAKALAGHPDSGSYGIHSPEVRDEFRAAFDLQRVIRHRLAFDRKPEGDIMVDFDTPYQISKTPLATITSSQCLTEETP